MKNRDKIVISEVLRQVPEVEDMSPPVDCPKYSNQFCTVTGSLCPHFMSTFKDCKILRDLHKFQNLTLTW